MQAFKCDFCKEFRQGLPCNIYVSFHGNRLNRSPTYFAMINNHEYDICTDCIEAVNDLLAKRKPTTQS